METGTPDYALFLALIAPQLPGAVFTFWRRRRLRWFVRAMLVLAPALAFFAFASVHFGHVAEAISSRGHYVCGAFGFMVIFVAFGGTAVHLFLGAALQAFHAFFTRRQERRLRNTPRPAVAV